MLSPLPRGITNGTNSGSVGGAWAARGRRRGPRPARVGRRRVVPDRAERGCHDPLHDGPGGPERPRTGARDAGVARLQELGRDVERDVGPRLDVGADDADRPAALQEGEPVGALLQHGVVRHVRHVRHVGQGARLLGHRGESGALNRRRSWSAADMSRSRSRSIAAARSFSWAATRSSRADSRRSAMPRSAASMTASPAPSRATRLRWARSARARTVSRAGSCAEGVSGVGAGLTSLVTAVLPTGWSPLPEARNRPRCWQRTAPGVRGTACGRRAASPTLPVSPPPSREPGHISMTTSTSKGTAKPF